MKVQLPFGFTITNIKDQQEEERKLKSFAPPISDDGAVNITSGGTFGTYIDLDGTVRSEAELVEKYREMSIQPEIEKAINEMVNESIVQEENEKTVELILEDVNLPEKIKNIIVAEFEYILRIINFDKHGYDIFKRWYIDGRHYYHVIIDENNPMEGIKELRYIDPRKIRKIREVIKKKDKNTDAILQITKSEYYLYNDKGLSSGRIGAYPGGPANLGTTGLKIAKDSIIHTTSGIMDRNNTTVLSYLHGAIKPLNQLRALEDASLIYHLSRAPERRVFKVEVGNLPRAQAEQYVHTMMTKHKNKLSYNASTGELSDDRRFMHMLEDYWLPMRGGEGTQIDVLKGGTQLSDLLESLQYFQDRLYRALQVPLTRMKPDAIYELGRATEITRDEVNFQKFIDRVRSKFTEFFVEAIGKQLILKNIIDVETWDEIKDLIRFKFAKDVYFTELKELEIQNERSNALMNIDPFVGRYYSAEWVKRNILKLSDDELEDMEKQMSDEYNDPRYNLHLLELGAENAENKANNGSGG